MARAQDARFTDSQLLDLWQAVIDPKSIGMADAMASDIASFTGEPVDVVLRRMASGKDAFRDLWLSSSIDPSNRDQVEGFYRDQFVEAYELANWHCGRTNGAPPLNYAFAAAFAKFLGLRRALDFGSGIGSGSIALAMTGCEVHSADIAIGLLNFVKARMLSRGLTPKIIDLKSGDSPATGYYDLITCFDVLEHVPDQLSKLRDLESYLTAGGYLITNLMDDSTDPDRPMHISSANNWLQLVRKTGLQPLWGIGPAGSQVLQKRSIAKYSNQLARLVDRIQGR